MNSITKLARNVDGNDLLPQLTYFSEAFTGADDNEKHAAAVADIANLRVGVYLHGAGERGTDTTALHNVNPAALFDTDYDRAVDICIVPQMTTRWRWTGGYTVLQQVFNMFMSEYPNAKSYDVVGHSLGGIGVYNFLEYKPYFFRTASPISGGFDLEEYEPGVPYFTELPNDCSADIRAFHGDLDTTVDYYLYGLPAIQTLQNQGYINDCQMNTLVGQGHNIPPNVYDPNQDYYFPWIDTVRQADELLEEKNGASYNNAEVLRWRDMFTNGPYKSYQDAPNFSGGTGNFSPATGDMMKNMADKLLNDDPSVDEFWDGDFDNMGGGSYTYQKGHYIESCAFYYLLTADIQYGNKAREAVLKQVRSSNPDFSAYSAPLGPDIFHFSAFAARHLMAYDYTKELFNGAEKTEVLDWFAAQRDMWVGDTEYWPILQFPQRNNDIYPNDIQGNIPDHVPSDPYTVGEQVVKVGTEFEVWQCLTNNSDASLAEGTNWTQVTGSYMASATLWDPSTNPELDIYAYRDANGDGVNRLYRGTMRWQNAFAYENAFLMLYFSLINDRYAMTRAAKWYDEALVYGTYPDGSTGEWYRNYDSRPAQGTWAYANICIEAHCWAADLMARKGDYSLFEFSSAKGLYGTESSTPKSLKTHLDETIRLLDGSEVRYHKTVSANNALTTEWQGQNWRWKVEIIFALVNKYYKDDAYKDSYLINNGAFDFSDWATGSPNFIPDSDGFFRGSLGISTATYMKWAEAEDIDVYAPKQIPITSASAKTLLI